MLAKSFEMVEACGQFVGYGRIIVGDEMPVPKKPDHPFEVFRRQP